VKENSRWRKGGRVIAQLKRGEAKIIFDPETDSVTIVAPMPRRTLIPLTAPPSSGARRKAHAAQRPAGAPRQALVRPAPRPAKIFMGVLAILVVWAALQLDYQVVRKHRNCSFR